MVDQVRFPPSIGGSGKIYTDDANPETGVYGGGHRINFFPMLADNLAGIGYVAKYAQAIDGAKANADRAEDARGYVEGYAGALKSNILDYYRRRATLGLDFERGFYCVDNQVLTETTVASDLLSVIRSTPKWVEGPDGMLREVPTDTVARQWRNGEPRGALVESPSTNLLLSSESFDSGNWSKGGSSITANVWSSPNGATTADKLVESAVDSRHFVLQTEMLAAGITYTASIYVKQAERLYFQFGLYGAAVSAGQSNCTIVIRLDNGAVEYSGTSLENYGVEKLSGGWWRVYISVNADVGGSANFVAELNDRILPRTGASGYIGDGVSGVYIWGAQCEEGANPTSYIPTTTDAITRSADIVRRTMGSELNTTNLTIFFDINAVVDTDKSFNYLVSLVNSINSTGTNWLGVATVYSTLQLRSSTDATYNSIALFDSSGNYRLRVAFACDSDSEEIYWAINGVSYGPFVYSHNINGNILKYGGISSAASSNNAVNNSFILPRSLTPSELEELTAL